MAYAGNYVVLRNKRHFWHTFLAVVVQAFFPSPQTKRCIKLKLITGWHPLVVQHHRLPQHPSSAQPAPQLPGPTCSRSSWPAHRAAGRARSPCGAVAEMLHSGHTWHCVVAKVWMNHLEAELLIQPQASRNKLSLGCAWTVFLDKPKGRLQDQACCPIR